MVKQAISITAAAILVTLGQTATAGGPSGSHRYAIPAAVIMSAEVDGAGRQLIISGRNLGHGAPVVTLGGRVLAVTAASPSEVTAALPAALRPATYRLTVGTAVDQNAGNPFSLQVPAASLAVSARPKR